MSRNDLEKLLGGYAAGTLTEAEQRELFEAALHDQSLFEALANEEALRDALADPACRARVLSALDAEPPSAWAWLRRPQVWGLAGSLAAACVVAVMFVSLHRPKPLTVEIAQVKRPAEPVRTLPQAAPAPAPVAAPEKERPTAVAKKAERQREELPAPPPVPPGPSASVPAASAEISKTAVAGGLSAPPPRSGAGGGIGAAARAPAPPPPPPEQKADADRLRVAALDRESPADTRLLFYNAPALHRVVAPQAALEAARKDKGAAQATALGLRYALLRNSVEVPLDTPLGPGDRASLRIESNESGWLYVLADGRPLFTGPVAPRRPYLIDAQPGTLWLILSRLPDRGDTATLVPRTQAQVANQVLQVDKPYQQRPRDPAAYAVNSTPVPDARVLAEIHLNSR